jgi:precorrin-3B synthase
MSVTAIDAKGWCPGILRPMPSGDGLIVRVRPRCGAFSLETVRTLADLAERLGNGHIDLTRRANLQLRGLTEESVPELQVALADLGLLDLDADTEAVRNVMVAPLAGLDPDQSLDVRPIAFAIEHALLSDTRLQALPAKFGLLVDGGGTVSIASERADICLAAVGRTVAFGLDTPDGTRWLGRIAPERAAALAIEAAHGFLGVAARGRMRDLSAAAFEAVRTGLMPRLSPIDRLPAFSGRRLGLMHAAVGVAAPFGRLNAAQLRRLAALAADAGACDLRLSPWRAVYAGTRDAGAARSMLEGARAAGLIVDEDDAMLRIEACPGAPDCEASSVDARGDARRLAIFAAAHGYKGSIHVSGCDKGCARSLPSDLVLAGQAGRYRLIRKATTHGRVERLIGADEFETLFDG